MNTTGQYGSLPVGSTANNSGGNSNPNANINSNSGNNAINNSSAYASTASTLFAGAVANANAIAGVGQYGNLPGAPASTAANQYNSTLGALQQTPHGPDYGSVPGNNQQQQQPMTHPGYGQVPLPPNAGVNLPAAPIVGSVFASGAPPPSSHSAYGALPVGGPASAVSPHAGEYGSTPTGRDTDAQANAANAAAVNAAAGGDQPGVSGSYGQLPTGGPPPAAAGGAALPPSPGGAPQRGGLMLPSLPPGAARRQPARTGSPAQVRRDPLQAGAVPLSPMRPPPTPGRAPASPAASPARAFQPRGGMALPPPIGGGGAGGNDWRGGNPNALPPAEPDEPPIGSFALDHLPPAQMDDFSRSGGAPSPAAVPSTDSDTMAALNARKLRATERANIDQQQWYFGSILRDDAAGVIANLAPGAFIVRTSSQPNSFALTFKHKSGEIQHGLLRELPQGWSIEGAPPYEVTLEALLKTHNGLNYNLVPQVRANYAQKFGGAGPAPTAAAAGAPSSLVAQDEYPVPDNQLAASGGAPPPLMRRPSVTGTGAPGQRGGLSLSPAPVPRSMSNTTPQRGGGAALPPPLVSGKSSPNLTGSAGGPQQPSSSRLCEICNQGRAVSRVKVAGQADLKLCCSSCLDMHVAAPMRAQLAERKMHVESIERQFGNKPKDKVALHQLMQLGLEISSLQDQLNAIQRK